MLVILHYSFNQLVAIVVQTWIVIPCQQQSCGTNDISSGTAPNEVAEEIEDLAANLKSHENEVAICIKLSRSTE